MFFMVCIASPFLIKIPLLAPIPLPTVKAIGTASPKEHGQAITRTEIDEIVEFIVEYYGYKSTDWKYLQGLIAQHAAYNTLLVIRSDDDRIAALCRWNILPTNQDMMILDIVLRPDWREKGLMKRMLLKGLSMYPEVKYLIFERHDRGKPFKKVSIKWLLKRRF